MRTIVGVVVGLVVAFLGVFAIEAIGHILYPPPAGIDPANPDLERLIASLPAGAFAFVVGAWFIGAFAGAWAASAIARHPLAGWIVAVLIGAGAVWTMLMIPHPGWMWAAGIGLPLLAAAMAQRLTRSSARQEG